MTRVLRITGFLMILAGGLLVVLATVIHDRLSSDGSTLAEELGDDS